MKKRDIILIIILIILILVGYFIISNLKKDELIGGCAGVALEHQQECCERWASENGIAHIQCVGGWEVWGGGCVWECR